MTTTTISDEQKKNAATLYESLKPLTVAQRKWNERVFWRAPKSLAEPDWSKLWAAARPVIKALQLDCGPWSESFTANQKYVLDFGFQKQLMGRTRLTQHEGHMLLDAIQDLENESRQMAGIKRKPLAELIAEKVVQKRGVKARTDMMRASWFHKHTSGVLTADQLGKAWRAKRIVGEKRAGRNYYSVDSVIAVYPEHAPSLKPEKH